MDLSELLAAVSRTLPPGSEPGIVPHPAVDASGAIPRLACPIHITGIAEDSRRVLPGDLFVALNGARHDGILFAVEAISRGAVAVVAARGSRERLSGRLDLPRSVPIVEVGDPRRVLSALSAQFYGEPTRSLTTIGVTGTNGKTTTTHLIAHLLGSTEATVMSTVVNALADPAGLTTRSSIDVQRIARQTLIDGKKTLVIEASSIGLAMMRLADVRFDVAVWIGVAPEHLGFHRTMQSYVEAKLELVRSIGPDGICAVHAGDRSIERVETSCRGRIIRFGIGGADTIGAQDLELRLFETEMTLCIDGERIRTRLPLPGEHNVINALAAAAAAYGLGVTGEEIAERLERFVPIPGRFETYRSPAGALVVIDFAHTPDALARVLQHLRSNVPDRRSRLIVVFGCTGDADDEKRYQMGRTAGRLADLSYVTLDNPKTASPEQIAGDVAAGVRAAGGRLRKVADRRVAIELALSDAGERDTVLVAGKGHELHQIIGDRFVPYNDQAELLKAGCKPTRHSKRAGG